MTKIKEPKFDDQFTPEFNEWFNENWPLAHWNSLPGQWRIMKKAAYSAYVRGVGMQMVYQKGLSEDDIT